MQPVQWDQEKKKWIDLGNFRKFWIKLSYISKWLEAVKEFSKVTAHSSVQFSSVAQPCPTLCDLMNHSTPGLPVHQQLPEFTQTHAHGVGDAIQTSHPLSSPSPPAPNPSHHQGLFQWVNSSHEVAKVLEFQLQHQYTQDPYKNFNCYCKYKLKHTENKEKTLCKLQLSKEVQATYK